MGNTCVELEVVFPRNGSILLKSVNIKKQFLFTIGCDHEVLSVGSEFQVDPIVVIALDVIEHVKQRYLGLPPRWCSLLEKQAWNNAALEFGLPVIIAIQHFRTKLYFILSFLYFETTETAKTISIVVDLSVFYEVLTWSRAYENTRGPIWKLPVSLTLKSNIHALLIRRVPVVRELIEVALIYLQTNLLVLIKIRGLLNNIVCLVFILLIEVLLMTILIQIAFILMIK